MTPRLTEIAGRHVKLTYADDVSMPYYCCKGCGKGWPCDAALLLQRIEKLEETVAAYEGGIMHDHLVAQLQKTERLETALRSAPTGKAGETHGDVIARYYHWYENERKDALAADRQEG